jgi:hypothetical protein
MSQDLERDQFRGGFGGQNQSYQSGGRDERQRFEQNRPNKRIFEDRERFDIEEQDLRAKLRREQEERRLESRVSRATKEMNSGIIEVRTEATRIRLNVASIVTAQDTL